MSRLAFEKPKNVRQECSTIHLWPNIWSLWVSPQSLAVFLLMEDCKSLRCVSLPPCEVLSYGELASPHLFLYAQHGTSATMQSEIERVGLRNQME